MILVFNTITIIFLGILGVYVAIIFEEIKRRPNYIVEKIVNWKIYMDNAIFITGSSGFIGSSLINFLTEKKSETYEIVRINKNNYKDYIKTDFKLINFYHFATHFSLNENDKLKIYEANYSYGEKLLNTLEIEKFNNFIYTNSIYSLSEKYAESNYIKSKVNSI